MFSVFKIGIIGGSVCRTRAIPSTFVSGAATVALTVVAGTLAVDPLTALLEFDSFSVGASNSADFLADDGNPLLDLFNVFFLIRIGVPIRIFSSSALSCVSSVSMGLGVFDTSVRLFRFRISSMVAEAVVGASNLFKSSLCSVGDAHPLDAA